MAGNAEAVKQQVEDFKPVVPLVQVCVHSFAQRRPKSGALDCSAHPGSTQRGTHTLLHPTCLPLQHLRNPGMRARHWDALSAELGMDLHLDGSTATLDAALNRQGLLAHLDAIGKTADVASKEFSIEQVGAGVGSAGWAAERLPLCALDNGGCGLQALDKLQAEWEGAELGILAYRDTGTFIVKASAVCAS
jgi:hypothetical protein